MRIHGEALERRMKEQLEDAYKSDDKEEIAGLLLEKLFFATGMCDESEIIEILNALHPYVLDKEEYIEGLADFVFNHVALVETLKQKSYFVSEHGRPLTCEDVRSGKLKDLTQKDPTFVINPFNPISKLYKFAQMDEPILLTGESGTGKSLYAKAIHLMSPRRNKPFFSVNCAAIPETLLESTLFGHEKGAFSGAIKLKKGLFELADGGTLFLDEIGEASLLTQSKLLNAIEEKELMRVGGEKIINVNIGIITATNKDLHNSITKKEFRSDLFYRIEAFTFKIPPLRERLRICPDIINAIMFRTKCRRIDDEAKDVLLRYPFPGNYRELSNVIKYAVANASGGILHLNDLPDKVRNYDRAYLDIKDINKNDVTDIAELSFHEVEKIDKDLYKQNSLLKRKIISLLTATGGNIAFAAQKAGVKKTTFYSKIKQFDIDVKDIKNKRE